MTSSPSTSAASWASAAGTKTASYPSSRATITMGRMPLVCLRPPSRDSSPRKSEESGTSLICPELSSNATAMGRS